MRFNLHSIDRSVFKLFVFLLPLDRFVELPFGDFFNKVITQMSTIIMFVGVFLLIIQNRFKIDKCIRPFFEFWLFTLFYTLVACYFLILFYNLGLISGIDSVAWDLENPFRASLRDIVMYFTCFLSIWYSYYNLTYVLRFEDLRNAIEYSVVAVVLVGLLQFGLLHGIAIASFLYTLLSNIFALREPEWLLQVDRGVCFWGSEPASASNLINFCLPYSVIFSFYRVKYINIRYFLYSSIMLFLLSESGSSSVIISLIVLLFCFVFFRFGIRIKKWMLYFAFLFGMSIAFFYALDINYNSTDVSSESDSIEYIVLGKLLDKENGSTATRVSTVCNDILIFLKYPVTGIGNGNQGFFFSNNIPFWTRGHHEVDLLLRYTTGIANGGGNFFASYLSGYGFLGVLALIILINKYVKSYRMSFLSSDAKMELLFYNAILIFLISGWYVSGIENNTLLFILALGCVKYSDINRKTLY